MADDATYRQLKAEVDLLKRMVSRLMDHAGITSEEADDIELNALLDQAAVTGNYKSVQDYQRRKNAKQKGRAA